jgi:hypothetical protein
MKTLEQIKSEHGGDTIKAILTDYARHYSLTFTAKLMGISYTRCKALANQLGVTFTPYKLMDNHERTGGQNRGETKYSYKGKDIYQWGSISGVSHKTIRERLRLGWSESAAYTTGNVQHKRPPKHKRNTEKMKRLIWNERTTQTTQTNSEASSGAARSA